MQVNKIKKKYSPLTFFRVLFILVSVYITFQENVLHFLKTFNPLNAKLNPICHLLAFLGAHHILHFSGIRDNITSDGFIFSYLYYYIYIVRFNFYFLCLFRNIYSLNILYVDIL